MSETAVSRPRALAQLSTALTILLHLALLLVFVVRPSWQALALALGGYLVRMWAITTGFHRYFSHRTFKTGRVFQFILGWLGTSAMQNGPLWWASWHRHHHRFSDMAEDVHSPVQRGFWHSHMGWYLDGSHEETVLSRVPDLASQPELVFLERHRWLPIITHAAVCFAVAGFSGLVWGFLVSTLAVLHATALINSLAHVWGSRRYDTKDQSRNNALLAILTLGEGWHNNHHHCMTSARQGFFWWEIDVSWYVLLVLEKLGVVWDVRRPTAERVARIALAKPLPLPA